MIFVSYHDNNYNKAFESKSEELSNLGFTHVAFDENDLNKLLFVYRHRSVMHTIKNSGCIWKPYIVRLLMENLDYGDTLVYTDCGDELLPGIDLFIAQNINERGFLFIQSVHNHRRYTKKYCFKKMSCMQDKYLNSNQLEAGFFAVRSSPETLKFIKEWEYWCNQYDVLFDESIDGEWDDLIRHSRDQSILTNLCIKYDIQPVSIFLINNRYIRYNTRSE